MGTDIHVVVERFDGHRFECLGLFEPWRSYAVFGEITPVRGGDGDLGVELVRLPGDANYQTYNFYKQRTEDSHNLTLVEDAGVRALVEWCGGFDRFSNWLCGSEVPWLLESAFTDHPIRLICWFDS